MRVCQLAIQHRFRDENVSEQSVSSGKRVTDLTHCDIPPFNAISFQMSALFIRIPFCLFASADAERRLLPRGSERRVICSQEPLLHKTLSQFRPNPPSVQSDQSGSTSSVSAAVWIRRPFSAIVWKSSRSIYYLNINRRLWSRSLVSILIQYCKSNQ